jgi:transcriptional regulator with XRE-family HTH domain
LSKQTVSPKDRDVEIGKKLRQLIEEKGTNAFAVSKATGIDDGYLYRMLQGKREWKLRYLEIILDHLGVPLEEFFGGDLEIPVVATFSATELFPYPLEIAEAGNGHMIRYRGKSLPTLKGLYALSLADRSMMPAFKAGTKFICQKDTWDLIEDEDLVVSPDEKGMAQVYRVHFTSDALITLRAFNPAIPDRTLPRSHLKLCDIVLETQHK